MRFADIKVRNKLALVMILFSLVLTFLLSGLYYYEFRAALRERVWHQLSSIRQLKRTQIKQHLEAILRLSQLDEVQNAQEEELNFLYVGSIKRDTVIKGYPIRLTGEKLLDLAPYNSEGKITVGILKKQDHQTYRLVILEANIQQILMERTGLGETGESYLVGKDMRMRSISRFYPQKNPIEIDVNSEGVLNALREGDGLGLFPDYRGVMVFSAYGLIEIGGLTWVILSEMDEQEALSPLVSMRLSLLFSLGVVGILVFIISYHLATLLVKPILITERRLQEMSLGMLDERVVNTSRGDEFGQMFQALNRLIEGLERTIVFADEMGSGNFDAAYEPLSADDKMGEALVRMKQRLKSYHENEKRMKQENQRFLMQGQESERSRFSKELHDGLGPLLTLIRVKVESGVDGSHKGELLDLLNDTIHEMRRVSNNLMPAVLMDFGAGEAIRNMLASISKDQLSIQFQYDRNEPNEVSNHIHVTLYRVAQEAVNNVLKHAEATALKVSLTEFPEKVSLFLKDNGKGFSKGEPMAGNGIRNMRERVMLENGIFEITSDINGTSIEVEIPLNS